LRLEGLGERFSSPSNGQISYRPQSECQTGLTRHFVIFDIRARQSARMSKIQVMA